MDLQLGELLKGAGNSLFPHLGAHASPSVQGASTQVEGRAALLEPSNPPPAPRPISTPCACTHCSTGVPLLQEEALARLVEKVIDRRLRGLSRLCCQNEEAGSGLNNEHGRECGRSNRPSSRELKQYPSFQSWFTSWPSHPPLQFAWGASGVSAALKLCRHPSDWELSEHRSDKLPSQSLGRKRDGWQGALLGTYNS